MSWIKNSALFSICSVRHLPRSPSSGQSLFSDLSQWPIRTTYLDEPPPIRIDRCNKRRSPPHSPFITEFAKRGARPLAHKRSRCACALTGPPSPPTDLACATSVTPPQNGRSERGATRKPTSLSLSLSLSDPSPINVRRGGINRREPSHKGRSIYYVRREGEGGVKKFDQNANAVREVA